MHTHLRFLRLLVLAVPVAVVLSFTQFRPVAAATITVTTDITTPTLWYAGNTYLIYSRDITVNSGVTLTIQPGVIVKFYGAQPNACSGGFNQRNLFVNGSLVADGTAEAPIYFTSLADDTVGGDTNNDGAATTPAAGNWGRMEFGNTDQYHLCFADQQPGGLHGPDQRHGDVQPGSPGTERQSISYAGGYPDGHGRHHQYGGDRKRRVQ